LSSKHDIPYEEIIKDLNQKANTNYKHGSVGSKKLIKARWKDGFTLDNFKTVHTNMCKHWLDTEQSPYVRPDTLYTAKMDSYLNYIPPTNTKKESVKINFKKEWSQVQSCFIGGNKKEKAEALPSEIKKTVIQMQGITEIGRMPERDGFYKYIEVRKELVGK
jgi:uncharacterized phage protein (TIGR02220 family)